MCGIAGIIARRQEPVRDALPRMNAAQAHRGPNDTGEAYLTFGDHALGLGHRRLSIIDLSNYGHQPMVNPLTGDQLIFNGEIYNFQLLRHQLESQGIRFQGHSDTEVLLHALSHWGSECISQLQGMFAFAFYNARSGELLLARDSIGIKPLYIGRAAGVLVFASEVRAILATGLVGQELDAQGIAGLLAYGSVQHPMTAFENIRSFPAGHYKIIKPSDPLNDDAPIPFWRFPDPVPETNSGKTLESIRSTMEASVRDHLISDVPVGVFLSSGIDSTIVACLGGKLTPHLRSFTVGFEDNPDLSELKLATETAKLFNLDHTQVQIAASDAESAAGEWLQSMDSPSMDGFNVYIISKAVRAQGITVALSGQGGDELFGGYPSFGDVPRLHRLMSKATWIPAPLRRSMASVVSAGKSQAVRQKLVEIAAGDGSLLSLYCQRRRVLSDRQLATLGLSADALGLTPEFLDSHEARKIRLREDDLVWSISQLESRLYMGNMLLRDGDTNGMAHCLEIRVPFLDQRMLDLAYALPGRVRLPDGRANKHLLRQAFSDLLRPELLNQPKSGFTLPIRRWMRGPLHDMCATGLSHLKSTGLFESKGIDGIWNSFLREPESPIWTRAFTLCILGLYLRDKKTI